MKLSLDMSLLLKSYAGFISRAASFFLPIISLRRSLRLFTSSFFKMYDLSLSSLSCFVKCFNLSFQIYGLSSRFKIT
jgi:hypothetical protein